MANMHDNLSRLTFAAVGVLAAVTGIFVNVAAASDASPFTDLKSALFIAIAIVAAAGALALTALTKRVSDNRAKAAAEVAAVSRIHAAVYDAIIARRTTDADTGPELRVSLRRRGQAAEDITETASAFIASLVDNPQCTVITGRPGSGKSTLIMNLAYGLASKQLAGGRYIPIFAACKTWTGEQDLTGWLSQEVEHYFQIKRPILRSWMNRGDSLLLLDSLDEVRPDLQDLFVDQLSAYLNSAFGGKAVLTCRELTYLKYAARIPHEQVASLQPIAREVMEQHIVESIQRWLLEADRDRVSELLRSLTQSSSFADLDWSAPLLWKVFSDGLAVSSDNFTDRTGDPAAIAVQSGDRALHAGDTDAALRSYFLASESSSSLWAPRAGFRAFLLLAIKGDITGARNTFERTVASTLEETLTTDLRPISDDLSPAENKVLGTLAGSPSLDEFQIGSRAGLAPSECNLALRRLRERGLVEIVDPESAAPRFRRTTAQTVER